MVFAKGGFVTSGDRVLHGFTCDIRHRTVVEKRGTIQARSVWLLSYTPSPKPDTNAAEPHKAATVRCADATSK